MKANSLQVSLIQTLYMIYMLVRKAAECKLKRLKGDYTTKTKNNMKGSNLISMVVNLQKVEVVHYTNYLRIQIFNPVIKTYR